MRLARIYLPTHDNDGFGLSHLHRGLELQLMQLFGGYTAVKAIGGWRSPSGDVHRDPVVIYEIATRSNDHTVEDTLRRIAERLRVEAGQEEIMVVLPDGEVMRVAGAVS